MIQDGEVGMPKRWMFWTGGVGQNRKCFRQGLECRGELLFSFLLCPFFAFYTPKRTIFFFHLAHFLFLSFFFPLPRNAKRDNPDTQKGESVCLSLHGGVAWGPTIGN